MKQEIQSDWLKLLNDVNEDEELKKLIKYDQNNIDITIPYLRKYYFYFMKQIKIFSMFLESLDRTYMPSVDINKSLFKWRNYQEFFNSYIKIKQNVTNNLAQFKLTDFQKSLNSIIIFYYGYNQFVNDDHRKRIDKQINLIIDFLLDPELLKIVTKDYKSTRDIIELRNIRQDINIILLDIYNNINSQHSVYNIIPKIQPKIMIDHTNI